jgi:SAM-dependent methyltransferase
MSSSALARLYWKLESWIVPGLRSSQNVYAEVLYSTVTPSTRWLDLGCGHQVFPDWIDQDSIVRRAAVVVGIDPDAGSIKHHKAIRNRVVGLELPFATGSFDLITANMVFEHLENPAAVLADLRRVLAPGGKLIFHTVNRRYWKVTVARGIPQSLKTRLVHWMEGRAEADIYPTHYRINTQRDILESAAAAGFHVHDIQFVNTSSTSRMKLGPFVLVELALIRLQRLEALKEMRSNIIATLTLNTPVRS